MIIRPYEPNDFEGAVDVVQSNQDLDPWPHYYPDGWKAGDVTQMIDSAWMMHDLMRLVAVSNEKVVGFSQSVHLEPHIVRDVPVEKEIELRGNSRINDGVPTYFIRNFIVHSDYHGSEAASRLLDSIEGSAVNFSYGKLATRTPPLNVRGRGFFEKKGFTEVLDSEEIDRVYYTKSL